MRTTILAIALALSTFACSKISEPLSVPVPSDPPEPKVAESRVSVTEVTAATVQAEEAKPAQDPLAAPAAGEAD